MKEKVKKDCSDMTDIIDNKSVFELRIEGSAQRGLNKKARVPLMRRSRFALFFYNLSVTTLTAFASLPPFNSFFSASRAVPQRRESAAPRWTVPEWRYGRRK